MRVLLPLRKQAENKQSSNENLVDLGNAASERDSHEGNVATLPSEIVLGFLDQQPETGIDSFLNRSDFQLFGQNKSPSLPFAKRAWKTTGLTELDRTLSVYSPRKRPRTIVDDSGKRPAIEAKLPAKPSSKMGLGAPNHKQNIWCGNSSNGRPLVIWDHHAEDDQAPTLERSNVTNDTDDGMFELALKKRGLEIQEQEGDGNCLFRAVSLQVYGDPSMHSQVRKQCLDFMERDKEHFSQFVPDEDFEMYIDRKRQDGVHGNNPEIQAISELFNRPIEVFSPENGATPLNIFHAEYKTDDAPIRLSYHDGNHYNAVVDPLVPTAGLGLGLPGLQPGLADKMQMAKAVVESDATADQMELERALKESQDDELQRAIKESKLSAEHMHSHEAMALSDVDATYFELEQAALEHSIETHVQLEHGKKQRASSSEDYNDSQICSVGTPVSDSLLDASTPPLIAVASLPTPRSIVTTGTRIPEVATAASVASAAATNYDDTPTPIGSVDEYPAIVQEMVMNGFDIAKVVRAVELVGENFEDLLAFLMSNMG